MKISRTHDDPARFRARMRLGNRRCNADKAGNIREAFSMPTMTALSNWITGSLLVLSIALCGCFDTRHLQVDVTEHGTGTGELQDQITRLNDQVEQLTARYGDLEGRLQTLERLIRFYPQGDLGQIQDIQKSIVTLQTEIRDQDERAAVAALTTQMITLQGQLLSIVKADKNHPIAARI